MTKCDPNRCAELLLMYYDGCDEALGMLWTLHRDELQRLALRLLRRNRRSALSVGIECLADDVYQNLWQKVLRTRDELAPFDPAAGDLHAWLFGILWREVIDVLRRGDRAFIETSLTFGSGCGRAQDARRPGILEVDRRRSASISADDADDAAHLRRELEQLPEPHRTVLELKFWERLTQTQIAEKLGVSDATVHRRLNAAYATLRSRLQSA